ncbi:MAG: hypothetical protein RLZZ70_659 [Candidatus Parcubacteria bacterium]|jgi:hypothetical protein
MKKYKVGRNLILWVILVEFLITFLHIFDYLLPFDFLLLGNMLSHVIAIFFFIGIVFVFYGLFHKKEYRGYVFSWWDVVAVVLVLLLTKDFLTTLIMPHPIFHTDYWI